MFPAQPSCQDFIAQSTLPPPAPLSHPLKTTSHEVITWVNQAGKNYCICRVWAALWSKDAVLHYITRVIAMFMWQHVTSEFRLNVQPVNAKVWCPSDACRLFTRKMQFIKANMSMWLELMLDQRPAVTNSSFFPPISLNVNFCWQHKYNQMHTTKNRARPFNMLVDIHHCGLFEHTSSCSISLPETASKTAANRLFSAENTGLLCTPINKCSTVNPLWM